MAGVVCSCPAQAPDRKKTRIMTHLLDQERAYAPSDFPVRCSSPAAFSWFQKGMVLVSWLLIFLALVTGVGLMLTDLVPHLCVGLPHAPISAAPLLLIGAASLAFQVVTRPRPLDLLKAFLVSLAFLLWGLDQMLPAGWAATTIGDIVIVLYVVDLGWMMGSVLRQRRMGEGNHEPG